MQTVSGSWNTAAAYALQFSALPLDFRGSVLRIGCCPNIGL